jgi:hypothetical protein
MDAGYPNRPGYLALYKDERYQLPEWHRGMEPNTPKEKFNRIHSLVRNIIERSFGVLKMKWQILYKMHKRRLSLLPWFSIISYVSMQGMMRILLISIGILTFCLLSHKDTKNMLCLSMPPMDQHRNQTS